MPGRRSRPILMFDQRRPFRASNVRLVWDKETGFPTLAYIDKLPYRLVPVPDGTPWPVACELDDVYCADLFRAFDREWTEATIQDCWKAMRTLFLVGSEVRLPKALAGEIISLLARFYHLRFQEGVAALEDGDPPPPRPDLLRLFQQPRACPEYRDDDREN